MSLLGRFKNMMFNHGTLVGGIGGGLTGAGVGYALAPEDVKLQGLGYGALTGAGLGTIGGGIYKGKLINDEKKLVSKIRQSMNTIKNNSKVDHLHKLDKDLANLSITPSHSDYVYPKVGIKKFRNVVEQARPEGAAEAISYGLVKPGMRKTDVVKLKDALLRENTWNYNKIYNRLKQIGIERANRYIL